MGKVVNSLWEIIHKTAYKSKNGTRKRLALSIKQFKPIYQHNGNLHFNFDSILNMHDANHETTYKVHNGYPFPSYNVKRLEQNFRFGNQFLVKKFEKQLFITLSIRNTR